MKGNFCILQSRIHLPITFTGFHNFYLGRTAWGVVYLFTVGLFGIGWLIDGVRMPFLLRSANLRLKAESLEPPRKKSVDTAYVLTFIPFTGLLGIQHYYLRRYLYVYRLA